MKEKETYVEPTLQALTLAGGKSICQASPLDPSVVTTLDPGMESTVESFASEDFVW